MTTLIGAESKDASVVAKVNSSKAEDWSLLSIVSMTIRIHCTSVSYNSDFS